MEVDNKKLEKSIHAIQYEIDIYKTQVLENNNSLSDSVANQHITALEYAVQILQKLA